jgi:tol-pal system protein YbgF
LARTGESSARFGHGIFPWLGGRPFFARFPGIVDDKRRLFPASRRSSSGGPPATAPQEKAILMRRPALHIALAAMLLANAPMPAAAQDARVLIERLDRLERDMNLMQRQVYRGGGGAGTAAPVDPSRELDQTMRMDRLESEMRTLTGQLEEINYAIDQLRSRLDRLVGDVDLRLTAIETGAPAASAAPKAATPTTPAARAAAAAPGAPTQSAADPNRAPSTSGTLGTLRTRPGEGAPAATAPAEQQQAARTPEQLPTGNSQEQYNQAFGKLRQGDYPGAEQALKSFMQRFPNDPLAGNAQYWLGETYYVRDDFNNAAIAFAEGYRKYPQGGKGPDSLLKLGMSLARVGQKNQACMALAQLDKDFPKASANVLEKGRAERQRLECDRAR